MKKENGMRVDVTTGMTVTGISKDAGVVSKAAPKEDLVFGEVDVVVSNSGLDRHGEKIVMQGIDTTQIKRNPTVLFAHDYSSAPIGKITKIWKDAGNLMARIHFAYDVYDFAATLYKLVVGGYLNAVSIGGIVKKWSDDYTVIEELEMIELSVVPVGAHPDALVTGKSYKKELGISRKKIERQYNEYVQAAQSKQEVLDKLKGLSENDKNKYINSLKGLLELLEGVETKERKDAVENVPSQKEILIVIKK